MSVIQESEAGNKIVVLQEFHASPEGEPFAWETSRQFRIGERVDYVRFHQDQHYKNHPGLGWVVVFDAADGKRYAATQTYFVTEDCFRRLEEFFAARLLQEQK